MKNKEIYDIIKKIIEVKKFGKWKLKEVAEFGLNNENFQYFWRLTEGNYKVLRDDNMTNGNKERNYWFDEVATNNWLERYEKENKIKNKDDNSIKTTIIGIVITVVGGVLVWLITQKLLR